jgi:hypothetical protein
MFDEPSHQSLSRCHSVLAIKSQKDDRFRCHRVYSPLESRVVISGPSSLLACFNPKQPPCRVPARNCYRALITFYFRRAKEGKIQLPTVANGQNERDIFDVLRPEDVTAGYPSGEEGF